MDSANLLTRQDVERRLHVSASTIRRLITAGELKSFKVAGQLRFDPADVNAYIEGARRGTAA